MREFDDLEDSDDDLKEKESVISDEIVLDIDNGFAAYALQNDRIKLLAAIVESYSDKPSLDNIRLVVEDELQLTLADAEPLVIAKLAASRAAREGRTIKDDL